MKRKALGRRIRGVMNVVVIQVLRGALRHSSHSLPASLAACAEGAKGNNRRAYLQMQKKAPYGKNMRLA